MSYILDALRKAEQQRDLGQVPGLATEHERPEPVSARPWPWILAALLTVNILLLAWFLVIARDGEAPALSPVSPSVSPSVTPSVTSPITSPVIRSEPIPGEPQQAAPTAAIPPTPRGSAPHERPMVTEPPRQKPVEARPLIPLPLPAVPAEPATDPVPESAGPETSDAERPSAPSARAATASAPPEPGQRPLPVYPLIADDLYSRIQGRLVLNMHVYSSNTDGRFVLLNMKKYSEGDRLFEGPTIDRITEDGVILSMDGRQFRLRAP
jgi:general secretion pathway protein B